MTNAEKYLKDNVSVEEFMNSFDNFIDTKKEICWNLNKYFKEFLNAKAQPTLTEDERVILKHINKQFYYIQRIYGELQLTNKEHTWCDYELLVDDEVFQFIKERRRI